MEELKIDMSETLYWTKKEPKKAFATFQRNQNKFLVNSLNQIDRKAAIMIRINTTLITGMVVFSKYVAGINGGQVIGLVLIICCFISLVLSVFAAKPPLRRFSKEIKTKLGDKYSEPVYRLFVVGLMSDVTLDSYEKGYTKIVQNQELAIGNQIRTHYVMELGIRKGFQMLEYSYNAFLAGFLITVCVFLAANVFNVF